MLNSYKKKPKVIANWHSRALLIDPRKTKLTIISSETSSLIGSPSISGATGVPVTVNPEASKNDDFEENIEPIDEIPGHCGLIYASGHLKER